MKPELIEKAKKIRLVIFDVDGVLTDGRIYLGPQGEEYKIFHVHDGIGLKNLQEAGIKIAIISSRTSNAVTHRMQDLNINYVYQGQANKLLAFEELIKKLQIYEEQIAYVGDDLPDLPLIERAGLGICVANAVPQVKRVADWQTETCGGQGAAREVCEFIIKAQLA